MTKNRFTGHPLPQNVAKDEIFWIDYCDDTEVSGESRGLGRKETGRLMGVYSHV